MVTKATTEEGEEETPSIVVEVEDPLVLIQVPFNRRC
jgi:hypothetical protein